MVSKDETLAKRMNVALSAKAAKVRAGQHEEGTTFNIRRIEAGKLFLPSGRICVTDAYSADELPPLNRIVPIGEYAVELVIAEIPNNLSFGSDRCAFAIVTFSDSIIELWQPITAVKAADPCFTDENPNGIVQEGGTALFSPEAGEVHFAHLRQQRKDQLAMIRKLAKRFGSNEWTNYRPGDDASNVLIVEGGMGDGNYECFVGLTKVGRMARLVIDFGIGDPTKT